MEKLKLKLKSLTQSNSNVNQFDAFKERTAQQSVVWSSREDPDYKDFLNTDYRQNDKLKLNKVDNYTHSLVYEVVFLCIRIKNKKGLFILDIQIYKYKVKPDPFKTLMNKKFCNIPLWLFALLAIIGLICLIGFIVVICIKVFARLSFNSFYPYS